MLNDRDYINKLKSNIEDLEIDKKFYREAKNKMLSIPDPNKFKEITMDDYINTL